MFIAYARAFNKATGRSGVLFESPFGRRIIDNQDYLTTLVIYIHQNMEKHGLVSDFREWPWSSYAAMLSNKPTRLQRDEVLAWFDGRSQFIDDHAIEQDERLIRPFAKDDWF